MFQCSVCIGLTTTNKGHALPFMMSMLTSVPAITYESAAAAENSYYEDDDEDDDVVGRQCNESDRKSFYRDNTHQTFRSVSHKEKRRVSWLVELAFRKQKDTEKKKSKGEIFQKKQEGSG